MPFRLLSSSKKQRIMMSRNGVPLFIGVLGLCLTIYVAIITQKSKHREDRLLTYTSANDYLRDFENTLITSTLRIQWMLEKFDIRSTNVRSQRSIIEEIIPRTIFQRMTFFKLQSSKKEGLRYQIIFYSSAAGDKLPLPTQPDLSSQQIKTKLSLMKKRKQLTAFALSTHNDKKYIHFIIFLTEREGEFLIFTSPLETLLSITPKNLDLLVLLQDYDTQSNFILDWQKHEVFSVKSPTELLSSHKEKSYFKMTEKDDLLSSLQFSIYNHKTTQLSNYTLMILVIGILVTTLIILFLRFILDQNRQVAELIINRTLDLEDALNKATEATLAKNRFLANISHELRTPLNLILGMLELIEEKNSSPEVSHYIQSVRTSGDHLLGLISDLLEITRKNDESTSDIKRVPFKCPVYFEEIVQLMAPECHKKGLEFKFEISDQIPYFLKGDPAKLRQILINLLRNAIKYTTRGFIEFKVVEFKVNPLATGEKVTLRISIKDSGVGIPSEKQHQIFERFLQLESTKVLGQGGVGLGLSIVKDLVSKLSGNITVSSEPHVGSQFTVDLDFEATDSITWKDYFMREQTKSLQVALISNDVNLAKNIKYFLECNKIKLSLYSPEEIASNAPSYAPFSHVIIDSTIAQSNLLLQFVSFKKQLIILGNKRELEYINMFSAFKLVDSMPLLPSQLWEALGLVKNSSAGLNALPKTPSNQNNVIARNTNMHVLIADDDAGNRSLMRAYFSGFDWTLSFAENGEEAIRMYHEKKPDIIIADLRMPLVDGFEMTDHIRSHEKENKLSTTPIVLVTADALPETELESKKHDVNFFITKPVRKSKMIETILQSQQSSKNT